MKISGYAVIGLVATIMLWALGCATITTRRANLAERPDGLRVYPPKLYLFVDATKNKSLVLYAPDYQRAYDVKPITVFAKQDFKIEMDDGGQLKAVTSNQDTTSILEFFKGAAQLGAKAAGLPVAGQNIDGTWGLPSGIYVLNDQGHFERIFIRTASQEE